MTNIFIILGPSGVGKDTIVKGLLKKNPEICEMPTYTTRRPRSDEKEGIDHFFIDEKKFAALYKTGEAIEKNYYAGAWYGTSKTEILKNIKTKQLTIAEIDVNGALKLKKLFPEIVLIFISAPIEEIEKRLKERGTNTAKEIAERLKIAKAEISQKNKYDYIVLNPSGHPEKAISEVEKIICECIIK